MLHALVHRCLYAWAEAANETVCACICICIETPTDTHMCMYMHKYVKLQYLYICFHIAMYTCVMGSDFYYVCYAVPNMMLQDLAERMSEIDGVAMETPEEEMAAMEAVALSHYSYRL